MLGAATVLGFLDGLSWVFELGVFFRFQYAVALVIVAAVALLARHRRAVVAGVAFAAVNAAVIAPWWIPPQPPELASGETVRVLVVNVEVGNDRYQDLAELIRGVDADVVGVIELSPAWAEGIQGSLAGYDHRVLAPEASAYGIGLYSRLPLSEARIERFPVEDGPPSVVAVLEIAGEPVTLLLTHVHTPFAGSVHVRHFEAIGDARPGLGERLAVCGDLNTVPWSAPVRKLAANAGLNDTYDGRGPEWSWPTWNRLLGVPLDNCLISDGLAAVSREHGPDIGSDHLPLVLELGLTRAEPPYAAATDP